MRERNFKVEIFDSKKGDWYCLEPTTSDIMEAMTQFERYVSFGRVAKIVGWLGPDVE